jgi:hypothetical protein
VWLFRSIHTSAIPHEPARAFPTPNSSCLARWLAPLPISSSGAHPPYPSTARKHAGGIAISPIVAPSTPPRWHIPLTAKSPRATAAHNLHRLSPRPCDSVQPGFCPVPRAVSHRRLRHSAGRHRTLQIPDPARKGHPGTTAGVSPHPALLFAFKGPDATICSAVTEEVGSEVRTARDRTRRRRLNKVSCAGWLPHDRGFVSGLPRSKDERRSRPAHNRAGGFPTAVLSPAVAPADLLLSTSLCCCRRVWMVVVMKRLGQSRP